MGNNMKAILIPMLLCIGISTGEILFSDDFEDGNADGWTELNTGATYFVSGGWYHFVHSAPDDCSAGSYSGDIGGAMSIADYSILVEVQPKEGEGGPWARLGAGALTGYWFIINPEIDVVAIVRSDGAGPPIVLTATTMSLQYQEFYWMRFEIDGAVMGGKVWTGTPADEPATWLLLANDATYSDPGSVCLFSHDNNEGGDASLHFEWDNIEVSDDITLELPAGTWAGIKTSF